MEGLNKSENKKGENKKISVEQGLIEKYGQKFFDDIEEGMVFFNKDMFDEIKVEEKVIENPGNKVMPQKKEFIISYIAYGNSQESESDFIIRKKCTATMDNHIFSTASGEYDNYSWTKDKETL